MTPLDPKTVREAARAKGKAVLVDPGFVRKSMLAGFLSALHGCAWTVWWQSEGDYEEQTKKASANILDLPKDASAAAKRNAKFKAKRVQVVGELGIEYTHAHGRGVRVMWLFATEDMP